MYNILCRDAQEGEGVIRKVINKVKNKYYYSNKPLLSTTDACVQRQMREVAK